VFDKTYKLSTEATKTTKAMASSQGLNPTQRKAAHAFSEELPHRFNDGKEYLGGSKMAIFESKDTWRGDHGQPGQREKFVNSLTAGAKAVSAEARSTFSAGTPEAGTLRRISEMTTQETQTFLGEFFAHLENDFVKQDQHGMPEEELLIFLSTQISIVFRRIWVEQMLCPEWTSNMPLSEYMAHCIWTSLKVHKIMAGFTKEGFANDGALGVAFTKFLAKVASTQGGNPLVAKIGTATQTANSAQTTANSAKTAAAAAKTTATAAQTGLSKLDADFRKVVKFLETNHSYNARRGGSA
jgi:hypothetical protein